MKFAWLGVAMIGLLVAACIATTALVIQSARGVAGASPYCIQVADGRADYRPARTLFDLSGLTMRAKCESGMYMQHHAILVVGNEASPRLFHWSYQARGFVVGEINEAIADHGPAVSCVPEHDFVDSLPMLESQSSDTDYVRFSEHEAYRIPRSYQPRWSGGSSRFLLLGTTAPDFAPLKPPWADLAPSERDGNSVFVEWNPTWLLNLMKSARGGQIAERSTEFGLQKTTVVSFGRDSKRYESYRYRVDVDGQPNGVNTTLIGCSAPSEMLPASCQHRFLNNGRHFYFRHRPEDLPNWRNMQKRLVDLLASFEASATVN
jgi:hypothetical protein